MLIYLPVPYAQSDFIIFIFVYHLDYIKVHWAINVYWSDPQWSTYSSMRSNDEIKHSPFGWANQKSTVRILKLNYCYLDSSYMKEVSSQKKHSNYADFFLVWKALRHKWLYDRKKNYSFCRLNYNHCSFH